MTKDKNYRQDLKYVPHHKMGIKLLDRQQLENLFPNYESLLRRIGEHRENLKVLSNDRLPKDSQYNLMYDNIYSILGKRGAGKTSAVFTIKKILQNRNSYDVVLPIIMPEMIPQECNMIGWILALLEEKVNELEKALQKKNEIKGDYFSECLHQPSALLKREYEKTKELCYSQFYEIKGSESFAATIINRERQTQNSFDFSKQLVKFWDLLRDTIKKIHGLEDGTEPLVYIIFDDVDLMPEAVLTLLSTIIKYLSHPNLIVFLTADEELLYRVIENNMNERLCHYGEMKMYSDLLNAFPGYQIHAEQYKIPVIQKINEKLVTIQEIPRLYGDKILPPSCRYYLKTFETYEDKSTFLEQVISYEVENKMVEEKITLEKAFTNEIRRYLEGHGLDESCNFLLYDGKFIRAYFSFWGTTSRQLTNEVLILREFITCLNILHKEAKNGGYTKEAYIRKLYDNIQDFAYNTLVARGQGELSTEEIRKLLQALIVQRPGNWGIYLNYSYLREQVENVKELDSERSEGIAMVHMTIPVIILLFFIENLLILEGKCNPFLQWKDRKKVHGQGVLVAILDHITSGEHSLVCKNQSDEVGGFLWFYEKILDSPEVLVQFSLTEPRTVRNYLNKLPAGDENRSVKLDKYAKEDPKWFRSMVQIMYFAHEGIYNVRNANILMKKLDKRMAFTYDFYYSEKVREFKEALIKDLSSVAENIKDMKSELILNVESDGEEINFIKNVWEILYKQNFISNLSEIEKIVIRRIPEFEKNLSGKSFSALIDARMGTPAGTFTLLGDAEGMLQEIMNLYADFKYYEVIDVEDFKELMTKTEWERDWNLKIKNVAAGPSKKEVPVIEMEAMDELLQYLEDEIIRRSDEVSYSGIFEDSRMLTRVNELNKVHKGLREVIDLAIVNDEDIRRAAKIVWCNQNFRILQKFYINSFLEEQKKYGDMRIDVSEIPYQKLYKQIHKKLEKNEGDYLTQLMKKYIKEGVTDYIERIMRG